VSARQKLDCGFLKLAKLIARLQLVRFAPQRVNGRLQFAPPVNCVPPSHGRKLVFELRDSRPQFSATAVVLLVQFLQPAS
jgi:hypothetical protein